MREARQDATWFVIPMFNEGEMVSKVVRGITDDFPHVVCVDDASSDNSGEAAKSSGAVVVRHPINLGQGAALQTGIDFALSRGAEWIVTFDSDGQHRLEDAKRMLERLWLGDVDVVLGSRFIGTGTNFSFSKKMVLKMAVMFENLTSGVRLTDAHNGLRAMSRSAAKKIRITQNRMAHASEIVAEIGRNQLRYIELPVTVVYTDYSRAKGQSIWNSVNILSDLLFK
jgi:glycosyltransferase involved in cell wall biosynthesis